MIASRANPLNEKLFLHSVLTERNETLFENSGKMRKAGLWMGDQIRARSQKGGVRKFGAYINSYAMRGKQKRLIIDTICYNEREQRMGWFLR